MKNLRTEPASHLKIVDSLICPDCGSTSTNIGDCIVNEIFYIKRVCDARKSKSDGTKCGTSFLTTIHE